MKLHLNKEIFKQFINKINSETEIDVDILEKEFEVQPIELEIIKLERIFVDKLFAAEFYYIRKMYTDVAKHINWI